MHCYLLCFFDCKYLIGYDWFEGCLVSVNILQVLVAVYVQKGEKTLYAVLLFPCVQMCWSIDVVIPVGSAGLFRKTFWLLSCKEPQSPRRSHGCTKLYSNGCCAQTTLNAQFFSKSTMLHWAETVQFRRAAPAFYTSIRNAHKLFYSFHAFQFY